MIAKFLALFKKNGQYLKMAENIHLLQSSNLFDEDWYLVNNPDVAHAKVEPAYHYLQHGGFEGRDPSISFSSRYYLDTYADVKKAGINPLVHYLRYGQAEGRKVQFPEIKDHNSSQLLEDEKIGIYKRNAWNSNAATERYVKSVEHDFFDAVTSDIFTKYINPTDKVLDVGAGSGRLSFAIADKGCEVVATDISESMLQALEETKGERRITTIQSDGNNIPVEDAQFDAVVSMDFMFHFPEWQEFLREKTRACKNGGYIIYNFYNNENLKNISDDKLVASNYLANGEFIAQCTKAELQDVCDKLGLEIIKLQPYNFFAENGLWFPNLTADEVVAFRTLYLKSLSNQKVLSVIKEFEQKIIKPLSLEYCARMVVVLRKK